MLQNSIFQHYGPTVEHVQKLMCPKMNLLKYDPVKKVIPGPRPSVYLLMIFLCYMVGAQIPIFDNHI